MPKLIKIISIIGTIAMLAVGGGIISHETHALHFLDAPILSLGSISGFVSFGIEIIFGIFIGFITVKLQPIFSTIIKKFKK
jgi:predicted DNA repair protein MutK